MTASTCQFYTDRVFAITGGTETDMTAVVTRLATDFVAVALADLGTVVSLPVSQPLVQTVDGVLSASVSVDMGAWPDGVMFGQPVWDFFASEGVEVDD